MSSNVRACTAAAALVAAIGASQLIPVAAAAEPPPPGQPQPQLHNITYRARIDGVSRNAVITYTADGDQPFVANPTMVPGRVFEANAVLADPAKASLKIAIDWPYSANLQCEILSDDQTIAKAEDFVGPRLTRVKDDPDYGSLTCGAPPLIQNPVVVPEPVPVPADAPPPPPAPAPAAR